MPDNDAAADGLAYDAEKLADTTLVEVIEEAFIVVTKAYCHRGHNLVRDDNALFSGYPGVRVRVKVGEDSHDITLSPIHGHHERVGGDGLAEGTRCSVRCPECSEELVAYAPCPCGKGTLRAIFLTEELGKSHVAAICDVWGCQRSRIVDEWEILSEFVYSETGS